MSRYRGVYLIHPWPNNRLIEIQSSTFTYPKTYVLKRGDKSF
jgi:aspartate carbamoyltransferase catalytic subunit